MTQAVYFTVLRRHGIESAAIYYDYLPASLTRNLPKDDKGKPIEAPRLVFGVRLDRLPAGHEWSLYAPETPLSEWLELYHRSATLGTLPPSNMADPPRDKGPQGVERGQWRSVVQARPWHGKPADPFPAPDAIKPKPDAPAFIRSGGEP